MSTVSENIVVPGKPRMKPRVRLKGIALPNEHGSWGILFEPLVAAMAVAFSPAAIAIALLFVGAFLLRQPLCVWLADRSAGRDLPQTDSARRFTLIFSVVFVAGLLGTFVLVAPASLIPLVAVAPLGLIQIYYDMRRKSRNLLPELTGAIALSSSAAVIALADDWTVPAAMALWGLFVLRLIPSILYVRSRLRLEKGKDPSVAAAVAAHLVAVVLVALLVSYGLSPVITGVMFVVLLGRAALGLSPYRKKRKAMQIGVLEVIFGVLTVLSVIIGHYLRA
ncbi:MAG: YwiC-like family protein [Pyrinomonadaceae bacterium]